MAIQETRHTVEAPRRVDRRLVAAGFAALAGSVFFLDVRTPQGISDWLLYLPLCVGVLWMSGARDTRLAAALCSALMVAGLFLSPPGIEVLEEVLDRALGLASLWGVVLAGTAYVRRSDGFAAAAARLRREVAVHEETERTLRASELSHLEALASIRSFLASTLDPLVVIDDGGCIRLASAAVQRDFGWEPEELVGQKVDVLMPEPHRSAHDGYLEHYHATGETKVLGRARLLTGVRKDGTTFPIELSVQRVERGRDRPWFTGILRDVTERARADRERAFLLESERAARVEAERATKAKDEFLATLSHELRTPLNAALGWVQILRRGQPDAATLAQGLEAIERSTRAQAQLIGDMLDVTRILSGKLQLEVGRLELPAVVAAALDTVRPSAIAKGVTLEYVSANASLPVQGDPRRIQQVIWNLLANAVKFTPRDGRVHVALEELDGCVQLSVEDTGQGIRPEFLPFVFDRFRQADSSITRTHGGLGLGLAIVKHLVGLHGGSIEAASPGEGKGAVFTLRLPRAEPRVPEHAPASRAERDPDLSSLRILVVDDDAETCAMLRHMLTDCRAEVATALSAATGLERVGPFRPDVIVSDLSMPNLDGFQFLREVRRIHGPWAARCTIALSALARPEDRRRAREAGFDLHLSKPVDRNELLGALERLARVGSPPRAERIGAEHGTDPGGRG